MRNLKPSILAILFGCSTAFAAGHFTLKGKLISFDEKEIHVQNGAVIYVIKKSVLSPDQLKMVKSKHSGDNLDLFLLTNEVDRVEDVKPKSKS